MSTEEIAAIVFMIILSFLGGVMVESVAHDRIEARIAVLEGKK